jgi:hypothetical protein
MPRGHNYIFLLAFKTGVEFSLNSDPCSVAELFHLGSHRAAALRLPERFQSPSKNSCKLLSLRSNSAFCGFIDAKESSLSSSSLWFRPRR